MNTTAPRGSRWSVATARGDDADGKSMSTARWYAVNVLGPSSRGDRGRHAPAEHTGPHTSNLIATEPGHARRSLVAHLASTCPRGRSSAIRVPRHEVPQDQPPHRAYKLVAARALYGRHGITRADGSAGQAGAVRTLPGDVTFVPYGDARHSRASSTRTPPRCSSSRSWGGRVVITPRLPRRRA